jgi:hypothetical protein
VLPGIIALLIAGPAATINLTFATPITDTYLIWFVGLAAVSTLALCRVIAKTEMDGHLITVGFWSSVVATVALLLMLGATIAWGLAAHQEVPQLFDRNDLTLGHATVTTWAIDVAVIAGAFLVALLGIVRGLGTRAAAQ